MHCRFNQIIRYNGWFDWGWQGWRVPFGACSRGNESMEKVREASVAVGRLAPTTLILWLRVWGGNRLLTRAALIGQPAQSRAGRCFLLNRCKSNAKAGSA